MQVSCQQAAVLVPSGGPDYNEGTALSAFFSPKTNTYRFPFVVWRSCSESSGSPCVSGGRATSIPAVQIDGLKEHPRLTIMVSGTRHRLISFDVDTGQT